MLHDVLGCIEDAFAFARLLIVEHADKTALFDQLVRQKLLVGHAQHVLGQGRKVVVVDRAVAQKLPLQHA